MKGLAAVVVVLLLLSTLASAQSRTYRAGIITVERWLETIRGAPILNTGYYRQTYSGNFADAFKVDYTGSGNKLLNLLADGTTVLELTKTGALGLTGYMDIDSGTLDALIISGTIDQDDQKAFTLSASADTNNDNVYGVVATLDVGTGTLPDSGGIVLREAEGFRNVITAAVNASPTDYDYGQVIGGRNVIDLTGEGAYVYGFRNDYDDITGGDYAYAFGFHNELFTGSSLTGISNLWGHSNFLYPQTLDANSEIRGLNNQIYGNKLLSGSASIYGIFSDLIATWQDTGTGTITAYTSFSQIRTEAGDTAYHYYAGEDPYQLSTGGAQYGFYANISDANTTNYSFYAAVGSGDSYLGSPTRIGDLTTNYASFAADGTLTLAGTAKATTTVRLPLENFRKGATAPTETVKSNTAGFLFDADAEILYIQYCVPKGWDQASDHTLKLFCLLNQAETANDDIDWETIATPVADHENALTANTQTPGANHDIGSVNADGDLHIVDIVLDYDDGSAPIAAGDIIWVALSRTSNVGTPGYVGGVLLTDVCLLYICDRLGE